MATILEETPDYIRFQTPDGRPMTVPRATAERLGVVPSAPPPGATFEDTSQPLAQALPEPAGAQQLPPPVDTDLAGAPGATAPAAPAPAPQIPGQAPAPQAPVQPTPSPAWALGGAAPAIPLPQVKPPQDLAQVPAAPMAAEEQPPPAPGQEIPQFSSPEDAAAFFSGRAFDRTASAIARQADIEARTAAEEAKAYDQVAAEMRERQRVRDEEQKVENERRAQIDRQMTAAVDAFANAKVDQNKWWASRSTGQKVLGGIAIALGALGGAISGRGTNDALNMIMGAIDQDIKLQMAEIDKLGQTVQIRRGQYGDFLKQMGSTEAAYNAAMAGYTERVKKQVEGIRAKAKSEQAQVQADLLLAGLDEKRAEFLLKAGESAYQRDFAERKFAEDQRQARSQVGLGYAQLQQRQAEADRDFDLRQQGMLIEAAKLDQAGQAKQAEELRKQAETERKEGVYGPDAKILTKKDGTPLLVGSEGRATELRKLISQASTVTQITDDLIRLRSKHGWSADMTKSPEWQEMRSAWATLQLTEKDRRTLGALSGSDLDLLNNVFGGHADPTGVIDPTPGLKSFRKNVERGIANELKPHGFDGEIKFPKAFSRQQGGDLGEPVETEGSRLTRQVATRAPDAGARGYRETIVRQGEQRGLSREAAEQEADRTIRQSTPWQANLDRVKVEIASATGDERERKLVALKSLVQSERNNERKAEIQKAINEIEAGTVRPRVF